MNQNAVILGVDPGFSATGYSFLRQEGSKVYLLDCGYIKLKSSDSLSKRVGVFYKFFQEKIKLHSVTQISLETSFLGKNAQTFLKLGFLRGILYLLADQYNLELREFAPREIKMAVTGFGGASKDQVANMVLRMFPKLSEVKTIEKADVTDALAVSICGVWQSNNILSNFIQKR
jgi:crossover junction endodeoxyribonuclease RuvC